MDRVVKEESPEDLQDFAFLALNEPEFADKWKFKLADNETPVLGQQIAFMGYPFGMSHLTCHSGYISSIYSSHGTMAYQIDGSVNGGNSGGLLLSLESGEVIGIVTRAQTGLIECQFDALLEALRENQKTIESSNSVGGMSIGVLIPCKPCWHRKLPWNKLQLI